MVPPPNAHDGAGRRRRKRPKRSLETCDEDELLREKWGTDRSEPLFHRERLRSEFAAAVGALDPFSDVLFRLSVTKLYMYAFLNSLTFFVPVAVLSAVSGTTACWLLGAWSDMPTNVIASIALVPTTFILRYVFDRRNNVFNSIADYRTIVVNTFELVREWAVYGEADLRAEATPDDPTLMERLQLLETFPMLTSDLLALITRDIIRFMAHKSRSRDIVERIYRNLDDLNRLFNQMQTLLPKVRSFSTRSNQYLFYLIRNFEFLKLMHDYRSASALRAYGFVFMLSLSLLMSPYFALLIHRNGPLMGYLTCVLVSFMYSVLLSIENILEDPMFGWDGINLATILEARDHIYYHRE